MAYTTINKSTDFFNTKLYTGNGSTQTITGVGFQPDFMWIKERSGTSSHALINALSGINKKLISNSTAAESTETNYITAVSNDGFSVGQNNGINQSGITNVAWNWVGGTAVSGNTGGSGTSRSFTGRINTTSKFGIYTYQGNGTGGHTIPHGLGAVPTMILTKRINAAELWPVYHQAITASKFMRLNTDQDQGNATNRWNGTEPTSTVFTLGSEGEVNGTNDYYLTYVFCDVPGYSKMGSYTGNGNADGTFVYTGMKPSFVMTKKTNDFSQWTMFDNKRDPFNYIRRRLQANLSNAENTDDNQDFDILSNGFKSRRSAGDWNSSGDNFIYMAFGQSIVGTNNIPCNAR